MVDLVVPGVGPANRGRADPSETWSFEKRSSKSFLPLQNTNDFFLTLHP